MIVPPAFRRGFAALSLVVLIGAPAAFAQAAPIQRGITSADLAEQTQRLQKANADLKAELGSLQAELASINGRVETLEFLLSQSREEINRMQGDDREIGRQLSEITSRLDGLAARLDRLEAGQLSQASPVARDEAEVSDRPSSADPEPAAIPDPAPSGQPGQTGYLGTLPAEDLPGESGELFSLAKSRLLQFDYQGAELAFRAFLDRFGDDPQAGEALYWLGEVLYQQEAYRESGSAYTDLIRTYPDDPRAPDALVKLARSMRLVGEPGQACAALNALDQRYPDASGVTKNLAAVERTRAGCDS